MFRELRFPFSQNIF